jgi:hypothetical protein
MQRLLLWVRPSTRGCSGVECFVGPSISVKWCLPICKKKDTRGQGLSGNRISASGCSKGGRKVSQLPYLLVVLGTGARPKLSNDLPQRSTTQQTLFGTQMQYTRPAYRVTIFKRVHTPRCVTSRRRRCFTSSGTSSTNCRWAWVFSRMEYVYMKAWVQDGGGIGGLGVVEVRWGMVSGRVAKEE